MSVVLFEKKGPIARITLNRPEVMNAMNSQLCDELSQAFVQVRDDAGIRVAIITGAGDKAFSAGADIKEGLAQGMPGSPGGPPVPAFKTMDLWKPLIAAVNGYALGGGCELALLCDIRVAAEHARFGFPEARLSSIPGFGGTQRLPRLIPFGIALEMLFTGEPISAEEAHRLGLVNKVVTLNHLMPAAEAYAHRIAQNGPLALKHMKMAAYRGMSLPLGDGLALESQLFALNSTTEDATEGIRSFVEKRGPEYRGR